MNYTNIVEKTKEKIHEQRALYANRRLTSQEMSKICMRLSQINKKASMLQKHFEKRNMHTERIEKILRTLRKTLTEKTNTKFVSIDTGFDPQTLDLHEVGVAIIEGHKTILKRYIVEGFEDKAKENINPDADVKVMSLVEITAEIQKIYDDAEFGVFHQPHYDIQLLNLDPSKHFYYNTAYISDYWSYEKNMSLTDLANRYNIKFNHAHDSVDDALVTYKVLIAMMNDKSPRDLAPCLKMK